MFAEIPESFRPSPFVAQGQGHGVQMKRRGFLGFISGAAVAGPGMAKAAVTTGLEGLSIGNVGGMMAFAPEAPYYNGEGISSSGDFPPTHPRHWVQRQLAEYMSATADELQQQRLRTEVHMLDPDLATNRSYSLAAKMRIQRDRNFERNRAAQKRSIMRDIKDAMKRWSERDSDI